MNINYNRLLSRKFIAAILSLISCSILMYLEKISDGVYSTVIIGTVGAYLAANVIQHNNKETT